MLAYNKRMTEPVTIYPPETDDELLYRAQQIAGLTLSQLAAQLQEPVPEKLHHAKGWVGQLLEKALGATAGSLPEPDFQQLGIELKTLPVNRNGQPQESTYVCTVPLQNNHDLDWQQSWVRNKLKRVLWVPIESDKKLITFIASGVLDAHSIPAYTSSVFSLKITISTSSGLFIGFGIPVIYFTGRIHA